MVNLLCVYVVPFSSANTWLQTNLFRVSLGIGVYPLEFSYWICVHSIDPKLEAPLVF